jgi:hypothetical protein
MVMDKEVEKGREGHTSALCHVTSRCEHALIYASAFTFHVAFFLFWLANWSNVSVSRFA